MGITWEISNPEADPDSCSKAMMLPVSPSVAMNMPPTNATMR